MQLSAEDQRNLRDAAADAWVQSGGKYLRSATLFKRDPRIAKFDAITVITLLMYAYHLWKWWSRNKISKPSIVAVYGEPVFGGTQ
jgi:hypothetical protein